MKNRILLIFSIVGLLVIIACEKEDMVITENSVNTTVSLNENHLKSDTNIGDDDPGFEDFYLAKAVAGTDVDNLGNAFLFDPVPCGIGAPETAYSLTLEAMSLCPSHKAIVNIWVCGQMYLSTEIFASTAPFLVPIVVPCDCYIYVEVLLEQVDNIKCKRMGSASASLTLQ